MTVNPGGEEDSPDPDAEETDVFLVMGADRRARKTREEGQETPQTAEVAGTSTASEAPQISEDWDASEAPGATKAPETSEVTGTSEATDIPEASRAPETPTAPEAPREHGSPLYQGASLFAPESETTDPGGLAEEADPSPKASDPVRPDTDTVLVQASPPAEADPAASVAGTDALPGDPGTAASGPAAPSRPIGALPEAGTATGGPVSRETGPAEAAERSGPGAGRASAPPGARDPEQGAPYPVYGDRPLAPTGFPDIPAAPYAGVEQPEPDRGVLRAEGRLDLPIPDPSAPYAPTPDLPTPNSPNPPNPWAPAQDPSTRGIESWIDAVGDGRAPVQGGYEQRIAAVRSVPASSWRRAVFAVTGGRLNLG